MTRLHCSPYLIALAVVLALGACGRGVSSRPGISPADNAPRNVNYKMALNDTGVTRYINGLFSATPDTPAAFNTTQYWFYATDEVYVLANLHKDPSKTIYLSNQNFNFNVANTYDWKLTPLCISISGTQIPCSVYDTNGNPHRIDLYFINTQLDTWFVRVLVDDRSVNGPLGTDLKFDVNGRLASIGTTELKSDDDLRWLRTEAINIMPAFHVFLRLSHSSSDTALYQSNQTGCAAGTGNQSCWKTSAKYTKEGDVFDLRATPPRSDTANSPAYPGQDADYGLDKTAPNASTNGRGFHFEKLVKGAVGQDAAIVYVDNSKDDPNCIYDLNTGLYWEHKTGIKPSLRYAEHEFSWYDPDASTNGGDAGSPYPTEILDESDRHRCALDAEVNCNTAEYIKEINKLKLCGYSDWRLPTMLEIYSLIDFSMPREIPYPVQQYEVYQSKLQANVMINRTYFPYLRTDDVWTSQTLPGDIKQARVLHLDLLQMSHNKANHAHVMLVRGLAMQ